MLDDDPGWPISWRTLLLGAFLPRLGLRRQLKRADSGQVDGLIMIRQVFVTFCLAIITFGVVLAFIYPGSKAPADPPTAVAVGLLIVAAAVSAVGSRLEQRLDCTDDTTLAASYRRRFFLRLGFSELGALGGFVGFFLTYKWWTYPVGAAITAVGFTRAAPTATHLARDQQNLSTQRCGRSLVAALRQAPPPRQR